MRGSRQTQSEDDDTSFGTSGRITPCRSVDMLWPGCLNGRIGNGGAGATSQDDDRLGTLTTMAAIWLT